MVVSGVRMNRVAVYYRVSTDKQDLASQRQAVETFLKGQPDEKQPDSVREYIDEGMSGKTSRRPGYQAMLKDAWGRKIDTIVVYRLDRMSRNATEAIRTLLALDEAGVCFVSVTQPVLNLGRDNPFRRTMLAAFAEIAEIERETIVARVKSGLEAARKKGVRLGAPVKAGRAQQLVVQRLRGEGLSYRKIAEKTGISYGAVHSLANADPLPPDEADGQGDQD